MKGFHHQRGSGSGRGRILVVRRGGGRGMMSIVERRASVVRRPHANPPLADRTRHLSLMTQATPKHFVKAPLIQNHTRKT